MGNASYYGYTSRDPDKRLAEHLKKARRGWKHNSLLYPALVRSGFQYEFKILFTFKDEFTALKKEIELIYNNRPNWNVSKGGEGSTMNVLSKIENNRMVFKAVPRGCSETMRRERISFGQTGRVLSSTTKKRIATKLRGRKRSRSTKRKCSVGSMGNKNASGKHNLGPTYLEDIRKRSGATIEIDGVRYESLSAAAEVIGITKQGISVRCASPNFPNYRRI